MKTIALVHTVVRVAASFGDRMKKELGQEIIVYNLLDDFLAIQPDLEGSFSLVNKNRLFNDLKTAELTGADIIVTTCSTLTPHVERIRPFIGVPVVAIDDAMAVEAVRRGGKVMVLASAHSTIEATTSKLRFEAQAAGLGPLEVDHRVCPPAYDALRSLDMETHDRLLRDLAATIRGYDCVVLAQASMAHLTASIQDITGCPVLNTPDLCVEQVRKLLHA